MNTKKMVQPGLLMKLRALTLYDLPGLAFYARLLLLLASAALAQNIVSAQNLFVANWYYPGAIYEFTPGGSQGTFYSGGLGEPEGLAFDRAGNLFVADSYDGNIYKITPGGSLSTFASGLGDENSLAFDSTGNLFAADFTDGSIYKFTPGGTRST